MDTCMHRGYNIGEACMESGRAGGVRREEMGMLGGTALGRTPHEERKRAMRTHEIEGFKEKFLELVQAIDSIELLQWSHDELEGQVSRLNSEAAHNINEGDAVEVTRGPAAGMQGTVIGRAEQEEGVLLVDLDGVNLGMPVPIPALALNVLSP